MSVEELVDAGAPCAPARQRLEPRHDADVAGDGHVREQPDILQHVADAAPQADRLPLASIAALDHDDAGIRHQQPVDELEERRLPGAAAADQRDDLACLDRRGRNGRARAGHPPHERNVAELDGAACLTHSDGAASLRSGSSR